VKLLNGTNIFRGRLDLSNTSRFISNAEAAGAYAHFLADAGDIVIASSGITVERLHEKVAVVEADDLPFCMNTSTIRFKPRAGVLDANYLFQFLTSDGFKRQIGGQATGSAQLNFGPSHVSKVLLPVPPLAEQQEVAVVLSEADALLARLDRLIAKKRDLKQAAMQQLLTGKTRLPGFHGGWEVKRICDFTECTSGGTPGTSFPSYWNGEIRWMSSGELNLKQVYDVVGRITTHGLHNSSAKMIPPKCVLIGLAGQGKTRGTVAMNHVELCTNQSIAAVHPGPSFAPEYLYYNLDSRYDELRDLSSGDGGRGGLNLTIINALMVPLPKLAEQVAIAAVLSDMDAELAALEARRDKTRDLKQGMMQELLTGRTRLLKPEAEHA
jgi:type I restriction enzyme S subunit